VDNKILVGRYELIEKIGEGGMATVWKARCNRLNRFVAVKILNRLANDGEFIKRFHIEAQAAASLSHPNIVSIFDVGYDPEQDVHFIVMEYVDGCTLKEYIQKKGALSWQEVVTRSIQICSAIGHAHRNKIIHKDIKPHNILLTKEGVAKVTDFGIARAVLSTTINLTEGTIGSVHYLSPEQARGGFVNEKSDIYSLGIVLYEMITGRVPFVGDTPVAVALKHLHSEPETPIKLNPDIPEGLNDIVKNMLKKEQSKRYDSVFQIIKDLRTILKNPSTRFKLPGNSSDYLPGNENVAYLEEQEQQNKKKDKLFMWVTITTSIFIVAILAFVALWTILPALGIFSSKGSNEYVIQDYVGKPFAEVRTELARKKIEVGKVTYRADEKVSEGIILSQSIPKGQKVKIGGYAAIDFEVSSGLSMVVIPDVRNMDRKRAAAELTNRGLLVRTEDVFSDSVESGIVVETNPPPGMSVKSGTRIIIFVSKGHEPISIEVPNVIGKTRSDAIKLIESAGLKVGQIFISGTEGTQGYVVNQQPGAGTNLKVGSEVDLYLDSMFKPRTKIVEETISLGGYASLYGETIKVMVEATPSDTGITEIIMDEVKRKEDFPIKFSIPVPEGGKTKVEVYLNNVRYLGIVREWNGL